MTLGVMLYLFAPQHLYTCMVFFLPFSGTAVANIGSAGAASGIQATIFFGALWMVKEFPSCWRIRSSDRQLLLRKPARQLGLFLFVVILSLIMPVWIHGREIGRAHV